MKKLCVLLIAVTMFYGCEKEREGRDPSACERQMIERFKADLKCLEKNAREVNLYTGIYKNEQVYFTKMMCPLCNTKPPEYGYTCDNKRIDFDDFRNVSDLKLVYNSCTKEFK